MVLGEACEMDLADMLHRKFIEIGHRLEAMIDARIDKALARLVNVKEFKRLAATYSPPLISADAPMSCDLNSDLKDSVENLR